MLGFTVACTLKLFTLGLQRIAGVRDGIGGFLIEAIGEPLIYSVIALGLLVALLRYRLYDAEAAISRSAAYAALSIALLAIFTGTEKVAELIGQDYLGNGAGTLAGGIGAALMIAPLHDRIRDWARERFQKNLIRLRRDLPALVGDLRETATLDEFGTAAVARLGKDMPATRSALIAGDGLVATVAANTAEVAAWRADWHPAPGTAVECVAADRVFPMRVPLAADGIGVQGWLLLGPRPDGSLYGKDALAEIADPIARGIAVIRRRKARERADAAERHGLRERLDVVEAAVARLTGLAGMPPPGRAAGQSQ